jgi:hypothetical protein
MGRLAPGAPQAPADPHLQTQEPLDDTETPSPPSMHLPPALLPAHHPPKPTRPELDRREADGQDRRPGRLAALTPPPAAVPWVARRRADRAVRAAVEGSRRWADGSASSGEQRLYRRRAAR